MHSTVTLAWNDQQEQTFHVESTQAPDEARRWLDEQFMALDCEPVRASGKVLVADKLLAIAEAAGVGRFTDAGWAQAFAQAAAAATARAVVRIDLVARTVGY